MNVYDIENDNCKKLLVWNKRCVKYIADFEYAPKSVVQNAKSS